jgi:hypothetical protein
LLFEKAMKVVGQIPEIAKAKRKAAKLRGKKSR